MAIGVGMRLWDWASRSTPPLGLLWGRPEVLAGAIFLTLAAYKYKLMRPASTGNLLPGMLLHDSVVFAGLLFAIILAVSLQRRALSLLFSVVALTILLVYAADIFAYAFFATRLYVSDLVTFSGEFDSIMTLVRVAFAKALNTSPIKLALKLAFITVAVIAVLRLLALLIAPKHREAVRIERPAALCLGIVVIYAAPSPYYVAYYGDKPLFENFVERNLGIIRSGTYSMATRLRLSEAEPLTCRTHEQRALNVLLVIVESLSSYQSRFFSGIEDWTPELDAIAQRETALVNFHANGWTSIGGLISLLGGTYPIPNEKTAFNEWGSPRFQDFELADRPLPRRMGANGYRSVFIGAGNLGFLGQKAWLADIGFGKIIGNDDPRFATQTIRGPFDSVTDGAVIDLTLQELDEASTRQPYLMVVKTVWSHRPFISPVAGQADSEETVIREADRQVGRLYRALEKSGFFDTGVLFITGDHRAMEPFRRAEIERFGDTARSRIPAIVATRALSLPKRIADDF